MIVPVVGVLPPVVALPPKPVSDATDRLPVTRPVEDARAPAQRGNERDTARDAARLLERDAPFRDTPFRDIGGQQPRGPLAAGLRDDGRATAADAGDRAASPAGDAPPSRRLPPFSSGFLTQVLAQSQSRQESSPPIRAGGGVAVYERAARVLPDADAPTIEILTAGQPARGFGPGRPMFDLAA